MDVSHTDRLGEFIQLDEETTFRDAIIRNLSGKSDQNVCIHFPQSGGLAEACCSTNLSKYIHTADRVYFISKYKYSRLCALLFDQFVKRCEEGGKGQGRRGDSCFTCGRFPILIHALCNQTFDSQLLHTIG